MITYLERYQEFAAAGYENTRVWVELTSLGQEIRQEPLYSDARSVARETMLRARQNIETLIERLKILEYQFLVPDQAWIQPDQDSIAALDSFEAQFGPLPLSLRMWYEEVGSVCLLGSHPTLSYYDTSMRGATPFYSDPLVINPLSDPPLPFYIDLAFDWDQEEVTGPPYAVWLAPDAIHKANLSGGGPTMLLVPNPAMDAPLISDQWEGVLFMNYLRECFQWGGFPGMKDSPDLASAELDFLSKDLLPL